MDLYELLGGEDHPAYKNLFTSNVDRHYDFLESMVKTALEIDRPMLFQSVIKAINFHAIVGLHHEAGQYRTHQVRVGREESEYRPPQHYSAQPLMDDFVNLVNWRWQKADSIDLASYALWRINNIHPFVNGNGRTARAVCYFIICVKAGDWLPGKIIVPEMLRTAPHRERYISALKNADKGGKDHLSDLVELINDLLNKQLAS